MQKEGRYGRQYVALPQYSKFPDAFGPGISLHLELMPEPESAQLGKFFAAMQLGSAPTGSEVRERFSKLADYVKRAGGAATPIWRYIVDIKLLGGYIAAPPIEEFEQSLRDWVTGTSPHVSLGPDGTLSEVAFNDDFGDAISELLIQSPNVHEANRQGQTIQQFSRTCWQAYKAGATHLPVTSTIRQALTAKTKTATYIDKPASWFGNILTNVSRKLLKQVNKAIVKLEKGKARAVVSSDDYLYLRMTYVSTWLETRD